MLITDPLRLIGDTPLLKLSKLSKLPVEIYAKLEMCNLTGSIKDRPALGMIEAAEKDRVLKKGSTIVESTSGNLGVSLAAIGAYKGYRVVCVVDPKAEKQKINEMKAFGAEIIVVNKPDKKGAFAEERIRKVKELVNKISGAVNLDQYNNPNNPIKHFRTTGPEIYRDLGGKIDYLVGSVSTGGSLCGIANYLKKRIPKLIVVGVEPEGSIVFGGSYRPYLQQGAGLSFIPANYDSKLVDKTLKVSDSDAFKTCRLLAKKEGIFAGGSSGAALYAALLTSKKQKKRKNIVVVFPDSGDRYLDTVYSDEWLGKHGII